MEDLAQHLNAVRFRQFFIVKELRLQGKSARGGRSKRMLNNSLGTGRIQPGPGSRRNLLSHVRQEKSWNSLTFAVTKQWRRQTERSFPMEPSTRQELASFFLSFLFYIEKKKKGRPHPLPERCSTRNLLPVCGIPPRTLSALNPSILNRRQSDRDRYYA
ncbi:MAG: hypothetical protein KJ052_22265, partial [Candidatus Hydrogenedentes bacterium]|nr:hypothetical protein [Candidatus Hydrogenedentota bacterium]